MLGLKEVKLSLLYNWMALFLKLIGAVTVCEEDTVQRSGLVVPVRIDLVNGATPLAKDPFFTGPAFFFNSSGDGDMYETEN